MSRYNLVMSRGSLLSSTSGADIAVVVDAVVVLSSLNAVSGDGAVMVVVLKFKSPPEFNGGETVLVVLVNISSPAAGGGVVVVVVLEYIFSPAAGGGAVVVVVLEYMFSPAAGGGAVVAVVLEYIFSPAAGGGAVVVVVLVKASSAYARCVRPAQQTANKYTENVSVFI
jgi:hypothetical protein